MASARGAHDDSVHKVRRTGEMGRNTTDEGEGEKEGEGEGEGGVYSELYTREA